MGKLAKFAILFALVCAMGAVVAGEAFAEELPAEFLSTEGPVIQGLKTIETAALLIEDMRAPGGAIDILCSVQIEGEFLTELRKDLDITKVVSLAGATDIRCAFTARGACTGTEALIEAINLPWLREPILLGVNFFTPLLGTGAGNPGYRLVCTTILGESEDKCTDEDAGSTDTNITEGISEEYPESNEEINPPGNCTLGGTGAWLIVGSGITTDNSIPPGNPLSVSS